MQKEQEKSITQLLLKGCSRPMIYRITKIPRKQLDLFMSKHPELLELENRQEKKPLSKQDLTNPAHDIFNVLRKKFKQKSRASANLSTEFTIEFSDIEWPEACPVFGVTLDYYTEHTNNNTPSLDRVDSNLGYVKGNVQVISLRANRIKSNGTAEEHRQVADYIDKYIVAGTVLA